MAVSVLRRYTPPTCTLEISAIESPLSRWTDRSVLKHLRFQLNFDDPRVDVEQQMRVTGDRAQLEALHEAVSAYVRTLLDSAPAQFNGAFSQITPAPGEENHTNGSGHHHSPDAFSPPENDWGRSLTNGNGDAARDRSNGIDTPARILYSTSSSAIRGAAAIAEGIYLVHQGTLSHRLHLGNLATEASGAVVSLSTLQLFDLANALDDYAADALTLPNLGRSTWLTAQSGGLRIAAMCLLTVGVTALLGKFIADVTAPVPQTATNQSSPSPDSQQFPVANAPGNVSPNSVPFPPPPSFPTTLPTPMPSVLPRSVSPRLGAPPAAAKVQPRLPTVSVPPTVPPQPNGRPTAVIPPLPPLAPIPQQAPASNSGAIATAPQAGQQTAPSAAGGLSSEAAPSASAAPEQPAIMAQRGQVQGIRGAGAADQSVAPSPNTAFDTIPQVAEVRAYFQQRWQPPTSLNQTLEYRLIINPNGSLQQVIPLGQVAGNYIDRTNIPLIGDPFVSAIASGQSAQIRLVLDANGEVKAFLERMN